MYLGPFDCDVSTSGDEHHAWLILARHREPPARSLFSLWRIFVSLWRRRFKPAPAVDAARPEYCPPPDDDLYLLGPRAVALVLRGLDNFVPCPEVERHRRLLLARQVRLAMLDGDKRPLPRPRLALPHQSGGPPGARFRE